VNGEQSAIAEARYYLPDTGHFISPDTLIPDPHISLS
jgi:hypothetical protein